MSFLQRGPFERRGAAAVVFILFIATGVILVFTGTLTRATDIEAEAERIRAEVALLQARVEAGGAEVSFLETEAFVQQVARSIGWGKRGETAFRLPAGAPSPPPIVPLGSETSGVVSVAPFDAWMELLFGG